MQLGPMKLYGYWRSSASYRVRIALALKGLSVEHSAVNLAKSEQFEDEHSARNVQALVPVLEVGANRFSQSVAIIEYLEDTHPEPALLPLNPAERARVRAAANILAADTAPIQNLRILKRLKSQFGADDQNVTQWVQDWIASGLESLERMVQEQRGLQPYLFGPVPGYAECFLVPQLYNARRFELDITQYPALHDVDRKCNELAEFQSAHPDNQHDAPKN